MIMAVPTYAIPQKKRQKNEICVKEGKETNGSGFQRIFDIAMGRIPKDEEN